MDRAISGRVNTGTAAIVVRVQDVEDQPPQFIQAPPVTRIPEDIPVNSGVLEGEFPRVGPLLYAWRNRRLLKGRRSPALSRGSVGVDGVPCVLRVGQFGGDGYLIRSRISLASNGREGQARGPEIAASGENVSLNRDCVHKWS